MKMTEKNHYAS